VTRGSTEKIVPMLTLALMFEEPSSGSKLTTYLPVGLPRGHRNDVLVLLRRHHGELAGRPEHAIDRLVGEAVELLHLLAVDVLAAGVAEDVHQAGTHDLAVDQLGRQLDVVQQVGELTGGAGMQALLLEHELRKRHGARGHRSL
jgi:hypothetical protein